LQQKQFETMLKSEQIREFRCFFDPSARRFHSVVALGKEVCGYPSTVHGGLTAAIVDETLGGLYTALLASGGLGLRLPGLTARLEVDYKRRLSAPSVIHVATEVESVEPRKVWMKATVTDGGDTVYATARALFVAPNLGRAFVKGLQRAPNGAAQVPAAAAGSEGARGGNNGRGRVQEAVA
jgi:acyl-coenzyme A thioesterase PaaI-like protein